MSLNRMAHNIRPANARPGDRLSHAALGAGVAMMASYTTGVSCLTQHIRHPVPPTAGVFGFVN